MSKIGYIGYYRRAGNSYVKDEKGKIFGVRWSVNNISYLFVAGYYFNEFNIEDLKIEFPMQRLTMVEGEIEPSVNNYRGFLSKDIYRYDNPPPSPLFGHKALEPFDEEGNLKPFVLPETEFFYKHIFQGAYGFGIPFKQLFIDLIVEREGLTEVQMDTYPTP